MTIEEQIQKNLENRKILKNATIYFVNKYIDFIMENNLKINIDDIMVSIYNEFKKRQE
jgi:hypothetical protein